MKKSYVFLLFVICLLSRSSPAQQLVLTLFTDSSYYYPVTGIRCIRFEAGVMRIFMQNGQVIQNSLTNIKKYSFSGVSSAYEPNQEPEVDLNIFPNPSRGSFQVSCLSPAREPLVVEILDITGKPLQALFEGIAPEYRLHFTESLSPGMYLCRCRYASKILTQSFLVLP